MTMPRTNLYRATFGPPVGYPSPINVDANPHDGYPVEQGCCSFHYPSDLATSAASFADAGALREEES